MNPGTVPFEPEGLTYVDQLLIVEVKFDIRVHNFKITLDSIT